MRVKRPQSEKKVVLVWVDAGTFDVINPLIEKGKLTTFRKIIKGGASGVLLSTIPPFTPTAWASFATGVNPGKHGVYGFMEFDRDNMTPVNSYSIRRQTFWSVLNKANKKTILVNAPLSYPVRQVNGLLITGLMTPGYIPCTYPEHFRKELMKEIPEYQVYTRTKPTANEYLFLEEAYNLLRARCDATLYIMENYDWDFLFLDFYYIDQIQHFFWKYWDATHPAHDPNALETLKEAIPKGYEIIDDSLCKILKAIDEDTTLIVMSDHGAGPLYKRLFINNYLMEIGVLKMSREGIIRSAIYNLIRASGVNRTLPLLSKYITGGSRVVLDVIFKKWRLAKKSFRTAYFYKYVDWSRTRAYSAGPLHIFVNRDIIKSTQEYERVIDYLVQKLYELRDPETGEKIVETVFRKCEIYRGEYANEAPDVTLIAKDREYEARGGYEFTSSRIVEEESLQSASHRMEGMLIMYGENLKSAHALKNHNIIDLAPTILYLMGVPLPSYIDGKIIADAFSNSFLQEHQVRRPRKRMQLGREGHALSKEEEKRIQERQKALGYI